ncbi:Lectin [Mycena sanguinolenta]|uniref:Lectin n=1 Tax=Mycena sanguinolenta TaxID=230812 RepID=A0A8H6Z3L9_9AGAR|nr:Lectin [Mycena sanguinolenta]
MFQSLPVEVQTSNFGGAQGTLFNDNTDASGFPNSSGNVFINPQHPITQMDICGGWVIDTITTTYQMSDGSTKTIHRGSPVSNSNLTSVKLNGNEIITQICGFAGNYSYYNQSLLIQLTLVITDTSNGNVRVVGPLGAKNGLADGKFFSVSNPLALAGFQQAGQNQLGIAGLSIVKSNMVE